MAPTDPTERDPEDSTPIERLSPEERAREIAAIIERLERSPFEHHHDTADALRRIEARREREARG